MATDPIFAATPKVAAGIVPATVDTNLTAPSNVTTVATAGANGTKIEEIDIVQIANVTTATGVMVLLFLYDGATYHLFDRALAGDFTATPVTANIGTANVPRCVKKYDNLVLPNGWSLRVTVPGTSNGSTFKVTALGADF